MTDSKQKMSIAQFMDAIDKQFEINRKISDEEELLRLQYLGIVKIYDKHFPARYEEMKRTKHELKQRLHTMRATIDEMHQIIHELEMDKIHLSQQQKKLKKKINKHKANMDMSTNMPDTFAPDQAILAGKRLTYSLLKRCTRIYIDQSLMVQQRLGGFMTDVAEQTVHPFEFRTKNLTCDEVADKLWQVIGMGSSMMDEWDKLFFGGDNAMLVE